MNQENIDAIIAGLGLSDLDTEQKEPIVAAITDLLETRMSDVLSKQMSDSQYAEFEKFLKAGDDAAAWQYISLVVPNYNDLLQAEMDKVKSEFATQASELVHAANEHRQAVQELAQLDLEQPAEDTQATTATAPAGTASGSAGTPPSSPLV
ncbi:hypothetical protein HYX70_05165 [Candidatus Saccharibacteria bacterium]|nr:hypothetical protein [Candidatus Saccharibacteria bacterium]